MIATVALGVAVAAYAVGFGCGWFARRSRLVAQIRELDAERVAWRVAALELNARALRHRGERDRCRSFLAGVFRAPGEARQ